MEHAAGSPLSAWESFYVIVGSSGAALTGLQFVVIALIADSRPRASTQQVDAFGTPTIVHFGAVLFVAAVLSAPWHALSSAALALGACGVVGVAYVVIVARRARRQTGYRLVLEDWLWHVALPLLAYGLVLAAAVALRGRPVPSLFAVAAAALLLLFIGIHNAWDTVTYVAIAERQSSDEAPAGERRPGESPRESAGAPTPTA